MEEEVLEGIRLKGEEFIQPRPNPLYMRVYGHPLCPYVERIKHILHLKKVEFQSADVDFPSRRDWFFNLGTKGAVPILELPNSQYFLHESMACALYVEEISPYTGWKAFPDNILLKAKLRIIIAKINTFITQFYRILKQDFGENLDITEEAKPILKDLEEWLSLNKDGEFFVDQQIFTLADLALYPHLTRLLFMEGTEWGKVFDTLNFHKNYPLLSKWQKVMNEQPDLKKWQMTEERFHAWLTYYYTVRDINNSLVIGNFC